MFLEVSAAYRRVKGLRFFGYVLIAEKRHKTKTKKKQNKKKKKRKKNVIACLKYLCLSPTSPVRSCESRLSPLLHETVHAVQARWVSVQRPETIFNRYAWNIIIIDCKSLYKKLHWQHWIQIVKKTKHKCNVWKCVLCAVFCADIRSCVSFFQKRNE